MSIRTMTLMLMAALAFPIHADMDAMKKRAKQMNSFGSLSGKWEVDYKVKKTMGGPDNQLKSLKAEFELSDEGYFVTLTAGDRKPHKMKGVMSLMEDTGGWILHVQNHGDAWIERYVFTFSRDTENVAFSTYTRNVHNWYVPPGHDDKLEFITGFGEGKAYRETD